MKSLLPIVLIALAALLFFGVTSPLIYNEAEGIQALRARRANLQEGLNNALEAEKAFEALESDYRSLTEEQVERLSKILPKSVDNVKLIVDVNRIATERGKHIKNVVVEGVTDEGAAATVPEGEEAVMSDAPVPLTLSFTISDTYEELLKFLEDLEASLRVFDVTKIIFTVGEKSTIDYNVTLHTYREP